MGEWEGTGGSCRRGYAEASRARVPLRALTFKTLSAPCWERGERGTFNIKEYEETNGEIEINEE